MREMLEAFVRSIFFVVVGGEASNNQTNKKKVRERIFKMSIGRVREKEVLAAARRRLVSLKLVSPLLFGWVDE